MADEVLRHAAQSVVFQDPLPADTLRLALMGNIYSLFSRHNLNDFAACAIRARSYDTIVAMSRKLINSHQFHNDPPRLLLAALASGLMSVDAFIDSRLQKHLSREVRLADAVVKGKDVRWNPHLRRYHLTGADEGTKDDAEEGEGVSAEPPSSDKPTKNNPIMVCIYGQLCVAARSYQSGICEEFWNLCVIVSYLSPVYLLHAYDYQPNDPVICLSLAVAYLGRAMQRQADNRHYMIAQVNADFSYAGSDLLKTSQSLAFLSQYRNIRLQDQANIDEVEFNFGRAFHQIGRLCPYAWPNVYRDIFIGLFHYASKHYNCVLGNTERRMKDNPTVSIWSGYR